jgi:hypothetical protein
VIHLPGHTAGHCGFYSDRHELLFSGDMFASYFFNVHKPPAILNSVPEHFAALTRLGPTIHHRRSFAPVAAHYGATAAEPDRPDEALPL